MSEIIQTIGRLRRAMPRNQDVMSVCDALEAALTAPRISIEVPLSRVDPGKPKLSRAEIQRNYRLRKKDGQS